MSVGVQLPDPVLRGVHDVAQTLLALSNLALGRAASNALRDLAQSAANGRNQARRVTLEDVIDRALAQGLDGPFFTGRRGEENKRRVRGVTQRDIERRQTVEAREIQVGQDDVGVKPVQRFAKRRLRVHAQVNAPDAALDQPPDGQIRLSGDFLDDQ